MTDRRFFGKDGKLNPDGRSFVKRLFSIKKPGRKFFDDLFEFDDEMGDESTRYSENIYRSMYDDVAEDCPMPDELTFGFAFSDARRAIDSIKMSKSPDKTRLEELEDFLDENSQFEMDGGLDIVSWWWANNSKSDFLDLVRIEMSDQLEGENCEEIVEEKFCTRVRKYRR